MCNTVGPAEESSHLKNYGRKPRRVPDNLPWFLVTLLCMYMYIHQLCTSPTFCRQGFNTTRPELQGSSAAQSTSESTTNDVHCVLNGTCTNVPWPYMHKCAMAMNLA